MRGRDEDPGRWCFRQIRSSILKAGLLSGLQSLVIPVKTFFFLNESTYLRME